MEKDYYLKIVNAVREAIFIIDSGRRIQFANVIANRQFGQALVGQDFVRVIRHPDCLAAINSVLAGADRSTAVVSVESHAKTIFDVTVVDLGDRNPDGAKAMISLADVSHVHEAEQMRSDFVANVSHELRSPLTTISGFIETLLASAKDDPLARMRFLTLMRGEADRMIRLIADLLSLSKVEAIQRVRPTSVANIDSVLQRTLAALRDQAEREGKALRLEIETPSGTIPGSEDELIQVFQNLIENSLKYSAPNSEVVARVWHKERAAGIEGPAIAVTVTDQGEGIPREHIPRLTERFYRVDTSRSRDKGGTGLGLAIVKHIVSRHRGRLQIDSERGKGSKFTVFLPESRG